MFSISRGFVYFFGQLPLFNLSFLSFFIQLLVRRPRSNDDGAGAGYAGQHSRRPRWEYVGARTMDTLREAREYHKSGESKRSFPGYPYTVQKDFG